LRVTSICKIEQATRSARGDSVHPIGVGLLLTLEKYATRVGREARIIHVPAADPRGKWCERRARIAGAGDTVTTVNGYRGSQNRCLEVMHPAPRTLLFRRHLPEAAPLRRKRWTLTTCSGSDTIFLLYRFGGSSSRRDGSEARSAEIYTELML